MGSDGAIVADGVGGMRGLTAGGASTAGGAGGSSGLATGGAPDSSAACAAAGLSVGRAVGLGVIELLPVGIGVAGLGVSVLDAAGPRVTGPESAALGPGELDAAGPGATVVGGW